MDRALPDVRDGLKPSQRRILVAMNDLNLGAAAASTSSAPRSPATPRATITRTAKRSSIPTLVRLAQDWNLRYTLIDGQGNFGSTDGDPPAAMRYTEARMTAPAMEMLADLESRHGRLPARTTTSACRSRRSCRQVPEPAGQRLDRHRGGHGVQPSAAQPARDLRRDRARDRQSRMRRCTELLKIVPGPDFPTGGSSAARTASSKATRPAAGASRSAPSCDVEERQERPQQHRHRRDSLRHHPQDDRRSRSPSA